MPFAGEFSGAEWNSQALLATRADKQHPKMRLASNLACSHDFSVLGETHSNYGAARMAKLPEGVSPLVNHGSN